MQHSTEDNINEPLNITYFILLQQLFSNLLIKIIINKYSSVYVSGYT